MAWGSVPVAWVLYSECVHCASSTESQDIVPVSVPTLPPYS
ncbi:hypothetical protein ACFWA5_00995 [Streptomyces mirabilis]